MELDTPKRKNKTSMLKDILLSHGLPKENLNIVVTEIQNIFVKSRSKEKHINLLIDDITDPFVLGIIEQERKKIGKPLSLLQISIEYYKFLKKLNDVTAPGWNTLNWNIHNKLAVELLNALGIDYFYVLKWFAQESSFKYWDLLTVKKYYPLYFKFKNIKDTQEKRASETFDKYIND